MPGAGWLKHYWPLAPMCLLIVTVSLMAVFPLLQANVALIVLDGLLVAALAAKPDATARTISRYWVMLLILAIVLLAFYVRLLDYRWPYLRNIDSYMFYRHMDYILQNNGVMPTHDPLILSPDGWRIRQELYPYQYLGAYSYLFFRAFLPDLQLWTYLIYFPAFLASLMAIPMYFIGKMLYDRKAGLLAAFFIVFDISNLARSLGGDPDTDVIVMFMPLVVMAAFLYTYKHITLKGLDRRTVVYSVATAVLLSIWAHTWEGYWYVLWLITGLISLRILISGARLRNARKIFRESQGFLVSYAILIAVLIAFTVPSYGFGKINDFLGPFKLQELKSEEGLVFPNVYVSVAELQGGDIKGIIQRTSPINFDQNPLALFISPFSLMIYALGYLLYSFYRKGQHSDTVLLLLIWFIGPFMATLVGVRFSILFSAPITIGSAILISKLANMTMNKNERWED